MKDSDSGHRSPTATKVIILAIVVAAVTALGVYIWQHGKNNDLNGRIAGLNGQITMLNDKLKQACQPVQQTKSDCVNYTITSAKGVSALIYAPLKNTAVTNPVAVIGEVPGNWSTEAQFPVELKDGTGRVVAQSSAHILGNWQTSQLVPFSAQLTYATAESGGGTLLLQKDNPSGLPENTDTISIPINFRQ